MGTGRASGRAGCVKAPECERQTMFGSDDSREMPPHFFFGALHIDHGTAKRADVERQNFSVAPRNWYVDATFRCEHCGGSFVFSADEQRMWYEQYGFYVDSLPMHCQNCRRALRHRRDLRKECDRDITAAVRGDDRVLKARLIRVIDQLCESDAEAPRQMLEHRRHLAKQMAQD